ncbi:ATP-binding protein [Massilia niabensis]|uniref:histidine kinase n=1 Tax=Massilia niabensis TaxID=544910 RepID=A0ABW0L0X1_9BURK
MTTSVALPAVEVLYEQAGCGLLITNTSGLILRANATLCAWLGFESDELVDRVRIQERLPVGARLFHQTHCEPILQMQGSLAELQVELFDRQQQRVPMLANIARRRHGDTLLDEWALFVVKDRRSYERELLTARKSAERALAAQLEAEQQLRALNAELSDADRRKDEFLATLSHELRNPLAPMRSALEVLKLGRTDAPPPARLLAVFDRQLHHLTHLVDDLMDISRITQNRMELRRAPVALAGILQSAAHDAQPQMTAAGHALSVTLPDPDLVVNADITRLTQVVVNLLTNAAKYTPDGGAIALRCWHEDGQALIEVRDNGIGIPPEALDSVFGMFSQLKPALDRSKGGLGIGLALVRGILALHGGSIGAHSDGEGRGSTFTVRLPLAIIPARSQAATAAVPGATAPLHPKRILIVDDNVDAADTLVMFMELYGCAARAVHTGGAALEALAEFAPEVALFDIGLPDMNGYELARRARALPGGAGMLLIAATGWGQEADKQLAMDAGFDHHLTKPIDFDKLRSLLENG